MIIFLMRETVMRIKETEYQEMKEERLEVTSVVLRLLEQMVDVGIDIGVPVTTRNMSALTLMLQGKSYRTVGRDLGITPEMARELAMNGVKQLWQIRDEMRRLKVASKREPEVKVVFL